MISMSNLTSRPIFVWMTITDVHDVLCVSGDFLGFCLFGEGFGYERHSSLWSCCCLTCPERVRGDCMSNLCTVFFVLNQDMSSCVQGTEHNTLPRGIGITLKVGVMLAQRIWKNTVWSSKTSRKGWILLGVGIPRRREWNFYGLACWWLSYVVTIYSWFGFTCPWSQVAAKLVPRCFKQIVSKSHGPKVYRVACDAECWRLFSSAVVCEFETCHCAPQHTFVSHSSQFADSHFALWTLQKF